MVYKGAVMKYQTFMGRYVHQSVDFEESDMV